METLKNIIKSKGIKNRFIADELGVSVKTLDNWNDKKSYPTVSQWNKLADLLNIGFDELHTKVYLDAKD